MNYAELETLGDNAKEISVAFHEDCESYGFREAVERYKASGRQFDINEMLLIGAWRQTGSMIAKGVPDARNLYNTPLPQSSPFVQNNAIVFVDFLVNAQGLDADSVYILGAFCAVRRSGLADYTFDVVWYLSDKRVIGGTWACSNITCVDGTTASMLSEEALERAAVRLERIQSSGENGACTVAAARTEVHTVTRKEKQKWELVMTCWRGQ